MEKILKLLDDAFPREFSARTIANLTGLNLHYVYKCLNKLYAEKRVDRSLDLAASGHTIWVWSR